MISVASRLMPASAMASSWLQARFCSNWSKTFIAANSSLSYAVAAIDIDGFAGEIGNVLGKDRTHQPADFRRLGGAFQGHALLDPSLAARAGKKIVRHIGIDIAGRDVDHLDLVLCPFDRKATRDGADGGLGGAVPDIAGHAKFGEE